MRRLRNDWVVSLAGKMHVSRGVIIVISVGSLYACGALSHTSSQTPQGQGHRWLNFQL